ncbi:DUF1153 domain-containing protein [Tsuneonella mangrovi]|uniref:DUF1153 domain-containing protein n=1 Tax=Tsuneonella mangrovi TaxID=1982042 RepID=UPI000BA2387C|nr:DUF1153 domain-containing protein [Tsuneonella mangrovi]
MAYPYTSTVAEAIKRAGLPKSHRIHWSENRKAEVVRAVRDEVISFEEARERYLLSRAEFREWEAQLGEAEAEDAAPVREREDA